MFVGVVIHADAKSLILELLVLVGRDTADVGSLKLGSLRSKVLKDLLRDLGTILVGHGVIHQNKLEASASLPMLALH